MGKQPCVLLLPHLETWAVRTLVEDEEQDDEGQNDEEHEDEEHEEQLHDDGMLIMHHKDIMQQQDKGDHEAHTGPHAASGTLLLQPPRAPLVDRPQPTAGAWVALGDLLGQHTGGQTHGQTNSQHCAGGWVDVEPRAHTPHLQSQAPGSPATAPHTVGEDAHQHTQIPSVHPGQCGDWVTIRNGCFTATGGGGSGGHDAHGGEAPTTHSCGWVDVGAALAQHHTHAPETTTTHPGAVTPACTVHTSSRGGVVRVHGVVQQGDGTASPPDRIALVSPFR